MKNKILVTGTAGFIGFHLANRLIHDGYEVVGLDNINDYYDQSLKFLRLQTHGIQQDKIFDRELISSSIFQNYSFIKVDLAEHDFIVDFMKKQQFDYVVNLAAQAGVRYSIDNPRAYTHSNIDGFLSIIEGARYTEVKHFIYASTSSVYGLNTKMPLTEMEGTQHPMALYAATKKANEMIAHSYSHLFNLPTTGLRFFTVYGPFGRPDMALFLFADAILQDKPIKVFNEGKMIRDFTFVLDIVESIARLIPKPASPNPAWNGNEPDPSTSSAPYQIFNIGNSDPIGLMDYIHALEVALGKEAIKEYLPLQDGDVPATHADASRLENYVQFKPNTPIQDGVNEFVAWYLDFKK